MIGVDGLDIDPVSWGDSDHLAVGDLVWAIGNPFGLRKSVTFGIVSALEQNPSHDSVFQSFFQTDAAMNPGSSGGPIVDSRGHVIGINTAILGESFRGISFAIPSNTARHVVEQLMSLGRVRRGWLGVRLGNAMPSASGRPMMQGAHIESMAADAGVLSPAEAAGIRIGDVVTHWDHTQIADSVQLARLIALSEAGQTVPVRLRRNGEVVEVVVTVGERP